VTLDLLPVSFISFFDDSLPGARFSKNIIKNLGRSWEVRKTYENLRKTYDHCGAVLGNCEIDYTVVLYVNKNNNNGVHLSVHTFAARRK